MSVIPEVKERRNGDIVLNGNTIGNLIQVYYKRHIGPNCFTGTKEEVQQQREDYIKDLYEVIRQSIPEYSDYNITTYNTLLDDVFRNANLDISFGSDEIHYEKMSIINIDGDDIIISDDNDNLIANINVCRNNALTLYINESKDGEYYYHFNNTKVKNISYYNIILALLLDFSEAVLLDNNDQVYSGDNLDYTFCKEIEIQYNDCMVIPNQSYHPRIQLSPFSNHSSKEQKLFILVTDIYNNGVDIVQTYSETVNNKKNLKSQCLNVTVRVARVYYDIEVVIVKD